jgi:hypothetical protein
MISFVLWLTDIQSIVLGAAFCTLIKQFSCIARMFSKLNWMGIIITSHIRHVDYHNILRITPKLTNHPKMQGLFFCKQKVQTGTKRSMIQQYETKNKDACSQKQPTWSSLPTIITTFPLNGLEHRNFTGFLQDSKLLFFGTGELPHSHSFWAEIHRVPGSNPGGGACGSRCWPNERLAHSQGSELILFFLWNSIRILLNPYIFYKPSCRSHVIFIHP